ncbi:hypothetical protein HY631_02190 [Candidatus Uhrbacteria bacterium]|nr:hypothetical protein [Candidatus Uhrbacteria bacterium]
MDLFTALTENPDGNKRELTRLERALTEHKPISITGERLALFLAVMRLCHMVSAALRDPGLIERTSPAQTLGLNLRKVVDYCLRVADWRSLTTFRKIGWIGPAHDLELFLTGNAVLLDHCDLNVGPWLLHQAERMYHLDPTTTFDEIHTLCALFAPIASGDVMRDDFLP